MADFDYHAYACNMRKHLSPSHLVLPQTFEINHKYFNAKCNEYWSPADQSSLLKGIQKHGHNYPKINEDLFNGKKLTCQIQIRAELLNKEGKQKKVVQFGSRNKSK